MATTCEVQITRRLNGVDLHDEDRGWSLQNDTSIGLARPTRSVSVRHRGRHGSLRSGLTVHDETTERLVWLLTPRAGRPAEDLYVVHDELLGVLSRPGLVLEHVVAGEVRSVPVWLEQVSEPSEHVAGMVMRVQAVLALGDPFLRSAVTEWSVPAGSSSSDVLAGTAPVSDAVVRFGPGVVDPSLVDASTGTGVSWAGVVPVGRWLFLDALSWRAWTSSSSSAWDGPGRAVVTAAMDFPGAGRLQLWPVATTTSAGALYPSTGLLPSSSLYPSAGGGVVAGRSISVVASAPCVIRGGAAWL